MKKDALEKLGYKLVTNDVKKILGRESILKHYVRVNSKESIYEHIDVNMFTFDGSIFAEVEGVYCDPNESKYKPFVFSYDEIKAIDQIIDECEKQLRA